MKRVLLTTIIGMATAASSFGQGQILFDNYLGSMGQIDFTTDTSKLGTFSASLAGTPVGSEFNVALFAIDGTTTSTTGMTQIGATISALYTGLGGSGIDGNANAGYFNGGAVTVPGYVPGTAASFMLEAWIGANYATATFKGISEVWTEASSNITQSNTGNKLPFASGPWLDPLSPGNGTPGDAGNVGMYVAGSVVVPEPTTFALLGLGSAALLIFRRK